MRKKFKGKSISIIMAIMISLILLLGINVLTGNRVINNIYSSITGKQLSSSSVLTYTIYDNQDNNNLKVLVSIENDDGIESVTKPDGVVISGNGKNKVTLDYIAPVNTSVRFTVKNLMGDTDNPELIAETNSIDDLLSVNFVQGDTTANVSIIDNNPFGRLDNYSYYLYNNSGNIKNANGNTIQLVLADVEDRSTGIVPINILRRDKGGNILKYTRSVTTNFPTTVTINGSNYSQYVQSITASSGNPGSVFSDCWISNENYSGTARRICMHTIKKSGKINWNWNESYEG